MYSRDLRRLLLPLPEGVAERVAPANGAPDDPGIRFGLSIVELYDGAGKLKQLAELLVLLELFKMLPCDCASLEITVIG